MKQKIIAYKVFNPDWTCRGFQYKVGETYKMTNKPILCEKGFHACIKVSDCFSYYPFDPSNKVAEVLLMGDIIGLDGDKQASNKIKIVREISWLDMLSLTNTGIGNSGYKNSGDKNSGDWNSGDWNSGDNNSGDKNSGYKNSGYNNSGNWNSGNRNSGNWSSGHNNLGDWNSGNWNSGHNNSGDWNSCNNESGYFNSITSNIIKVFNKDCNRIDWENAKKPSFIFFNLNKWVSFSDMSEQEKVDFPEGYACGGYLKTCKYKEAWQNAFSKATPEDIILLKALPNFDKQVFYDISGIMID